MNLPPKPSPDAANLEASFQALWDASRRDPDPSVAVRKDRLSRLAALLARYAGDFEVAISDDFGHRSRHETRFAEAVIVETAIKTARRRVGGWMRSRRIATQPQFWPGANRLLPQPLGVVGVIAPWNYPLQLSLAPAVAALAAGNRVMIKPSELVPRFSALLRTGLGEFFSDREAAVIEGGPAVAQRFAALPFDHLLFTGSTRVGRLVAESAARNLTPATLELGGKSPAVIDRSADLGVAARRIAFGKLLNAGQTCIAPDYVLCPDNLQERFGLAYFAAVAKLYRRDPGNPDYTAIINAAHYDRLEHLLADATSKGGEVDMGGSRPEEWKAVGKFPPCIVRATTEDMLVRREEIFGPILPIVAYHDVEDAIALVNRHERPLALYWFGTDRDARDRVLRRTVSGGVTVNDCLVHIAQEHQPFGGVGASGMGAYHGEWGFRAFSKEKPIFYQRRRAALDLLQPPYGATFDRLIALVRRFG